ncbi:hypothetical protein [Aquifex aeolicus]|uniref:CARD domain-containing protein n=1 Tax=Aquifex aeolicus (strain VF5) TaxID=224324 RepID=O66577_AQUAE|nr:hypothetical protein [Aquifex aeolicus]AAC06533.1 putative protein [Aquifex aeolicus VF5]
MKEALILFFLIVSYNYLLYYITAKDLALIPLFPENPEEIILVIAFNSALYIGWFFGERRKLVTILGYLFFFQTVLLSLVKKDPYTFVSTAFPVIFTLMLVALFKSPFERELERIQKEKEALLEELEKNEEVRQKVEEERERLKKEISLIKLQIEQKERELERAKEAQEKLEEVEKKEKEVNKLKEKLRELEKNLKKQKEKEEKLLESNRKLFQLLELLGRKEDKRRGSKEVRELRKERKKLVKEVLELQDLLEIYSRENEELKKELEKLKSELEGAKKEIAKLLTEKENLSKAVKKKEEIYEEVLRVFLPNVKFTPEALQEFMSLSTQEKRRFLRELEKLEEGTKLESLTNVHGVYKLKFGGGRIYVRKEGDRWVVIGILDTEQDKEKERYIESLRDRLY